MQLMEVRNTCMRTHASAHARTHTFTVYAERKKWICDAVMGAVGSLATDW